MWNRKLAKLNELVIISYFTVLFYASTPVCVCVCVYFQSGFHDLQCAYIIRIRTECRVFII